MPHYFKLKLLNDLKTQLHIHPNSQFSGPLQMKFSHEHHVTPSTVLISQVYQLHTLPSDSTPPLLSLSLSCSLCPSSFSFSLSLCPSSLSFSLYLFLLTVTLDPEMWMVT